jgi:hypothetical protein
MLASFVAPRQARSDVFRFTQSRASEVDGRARKPGATAGGAPEVDGEAASHRG